MPEVFDTEAIIDTKAWIKPLRQHKPWILEEYRHGRPPLFALLCHDHSEESGEATLDLHSVDVWSVSPESHRETEGWPFVETCGV